MDTVFPEILADIDDFLAGEPVPPDMSERLLGMAERVLETWLAARGEEPTRLTVEGFRLLALHRQGCKGAPSFNACRETCREIVFRRNMVSHSGNDAVETLKQLRLQAMVVKHLALFVGGKLAEDDLGDFCCSSRPLHAAGAA